MNQTRFMHFRNFPNGYTVDCHGGATVAIQQDPTTQGRVVAAVARCGRDDLFNKKIGRAIAEQRLKAWMEGNPGALKYVTVVEVTEGTTSKAAVYASLKEEMYEKHGLE